MNLILDTSENIPKIPENCLLCGDCTAIMRSIPDNSIDLIVTSPPYFVNKNYEKEWTLKEYELLMSESFKQFFRILKQGSYCIVNFGDYFNNNRFYKSEIPSVYPASINYFNWGRNEGFDLQATRIWRKQFSRMSIPFVCNTHPRPIFDYEHVWTYRKPGESKEFVNDRKKSQRGVIGEDWSTSARISSHEAAFPVELPIWAIDVYSKNLNDIVLDPFCGIGTTIIAAHRTGRKFIGIEKNKEHCIMAKDRFYSDGKIPKTTGRVGDKKFVCRDIV